MTMTMIFDLSQDLIEEILSRVQITSRGTVRSTLKGWNVISNDQSFMEKQCVKATAKEIMLIIIDNYRACLVNVNLHDPKDLIEPSIKITGKFSPVEIFKVFHCDGLLLCFPRDNLRRLMVWNPYSGQVRWIQPLNTYRYLSDRYVMGYDNEKKHKFFRFSTGKYYSRLRGRNVNCEIYNFKSDSWKVFKDIPKWYIQFYHRQCVTLKGNTYFVASDTLKPHTGECLLCFDFTREIFGPRLQLPVHSYLNDVLILSTVREEQLAVLFQSRRSKTGEVEIWITSRIEPDTVSWRTFLKFYMKPSSGIRVFRNGTFFIDEKKKVAVICCLDINDRNRKKTYVVGEDGDYKLINLEKFTSAWLNGCSYVPSLVQIK